MGTGAEKAALRRDLRERRAGLPASRRAAAAAALSQRLLALPELAAARTVLGYAAAAPEPDIDAALEHLCAGAVTVCLPWVEGTELGVAAVDGLADLEPGWRGIREPPPPRRIVAPDALDVVLAPGLGFDVQGHRLGHGGGHFDRLLARVRHDALVVGVAFDEQVVDTIPVEAHDRAMHLLVTPTRTLRPTR